MNKYWRYYNHAAVPNTAPNEVPDLLPIINGDIWKYNTKILFAKWTSNFDLKIETPWWFCIKDTPLNIEDLPAKKRYRITVGLRNFDVHRIAAHEYSNEIYHIYNEAFASYPNQNRKTFGYEDIYNMIQSWDIKNVVYGAFHKETETLAGILLMTERLKCIDLTSQKAIPKYEKYQVNAALLYRALIDYQDEIQKGRFICDGERNISHITKFQDYLENLFGFRKAYCVLHIVYRPIMRPIIKILYPFKKWLRTFDRVPFVHNILSVIKLEEIRRQFTSKYSTAGL